MTWSAFYKVALNKGNCELFVVYDSTLAIIVWGLVEKQKKIEWESNCMSFDALKFEVF